MLYEVITSPGQVVIAGHATAVERAMALAKEKGAKRALPLPVSAPFHCALMVPAGERLASVLDTIQFAPLTVPVVSNVEAKPNQDAARVRSLLVQQVSVINSYSIHYTKLYDAIGSLPTYVTTASAG